MEATHFLQSFYFSQFVCKVDGYAAPCLLQFKLEGYAATRLLQFKVDGYASVCYANLMLNG